MENLVEMETFLFHYLERETFWEIYLLVKETFELFEVIWIFLVILICLVWENEIEIYLF